jgi:hypothetical protein
VAASIDKRSIEGRIEALERSFGGTTPGHNPERERILEELKELEAAGKAKAAAEEAAGNPRRRELLAELEATVKRRVAERQAREVGF